MKKLLLGLTVLATLTACPTPNGGTGGTGSANLTFANAAGGYNGSAVTISSTTVLAGVTMIASTGTGASKRSLTAFLPTDSRVAGTTYVINDTPNSGVIYFEGTGNTEKMWTTLSGSIRVVAKSGRTMTFQLIDVRLGNEGNTSASAGTVTVNGTMTGESITPL